MTLADKMKGAGKVLALVGSLSSPFYFSGCVAHGSPQEMSNFLFRDIMGFPGMEEKKQENPQNSQSEINKNTGNDITLGEFYKNSPEYKFDNEKFEFKRRQIIEYGGMILYKPSIQDKIEEPFRDIGDIYHSNERIALGALFPLPYTEKFLWIRLENLDNKKCIVYHPSKENPIEHPFDMQTYFSGGFFAKDNEMYYEIQFNAKNIIDRLKSGNFETALYLADAEMNKKVLESPLNLENPLYRRHFRIDN